MNILYSLLIAAIVIAMIFDYRHFRKSGGGYISGPKAEGHSNKKADK